MLGNSSDNQPLGAGNVADDTYNGGVAGSRNVLGSVQRSSSVRRLVYTSSPAAMNNSSGQEPMGESVIKCPHPSARAQSQLSLHISFQLTAPPMAKALEAERRRVDGGGLGLRRHRVLPG